jgi:hypothetical protein
MTADIDFLREMLERLDDGDLDMVRTMVADWIHELEHNACGTDGPAPAKAGEDETNVQLVARIMKRAPTGAIVQPFVLQALDQFSKAVIATPADKVPANPIIHWPAWARTAEYVLDEVTKHLERR